MASNKMIEGIV